MTRQPSSAPHRSEEAPFEPAYRELHRRGLLVERALEALARLERCDLCARYCRVDRLSTIKGAVGVRHHCGASGVPSAARVHAYVYHVSRR